MSSLQKFLKSIGLNEKDQEVYLALLRLADASAAQIARKINVKRTTVYDSLKRLIAKGIIGSYIEKGVKRFVAENPNKIKGVIEGMLERVDKFLPELQKEYRIHGPATVRFFDGEEGLKALSEDALECKEKMIYSLGSTKIAKEAGGTGIGFSKRRVKNKIFAKTLRPKEESAGKDYSAQKQQEEFRQVRFLPENIEFPALINIYDNKVAVIASKEEGFGFLVESEDFAGAMKSVFELLWESADRR